MSMSACPDHFYFQAESELAEEPKGKGQKHKGKVSKVLKNEDIKGEMYLGRKLFPESGGSALFFAWCR